MKPPVQQQSIWHCVKVKKWEHTVLPYGRKNSLPFPFFAAAALRFSPCPLRERDENQRVETAGVYPLAHRRGRGEPPRQRLAPIRTSPVESETKEKPAAHAAGFNFTKCRECYSLFSASRRALFAAITFSCTGTGASS